jgi:ribonuclease PH
MNIKIGNLNKADGSCELTKGDTKVIAAVHGPMEVKLKNELPNRAFLEVQVKPLNYVTPKHKRLESIIEQTFKNTILSSLYPRSNILIVVQIIYDGGELLASAINAVMLALINSGISVSNRVVAVESKDIMVAFDQQTMEIVSLELYMGCSHDLSYLIEKKHEECRAVWDELKSSIEESINMDISINLS